MAIYIFLTTETIFTLNKYFSNFHGHFLETFEYFFEMSGMFFFMETKIISQPMAQFF